MIYSLIVPETLEETGRVRVLEWRGAVGDSFGPGDLILELETHKVVIEVRAEQACVLRVCQGAQGDWCATGATIAILADSAAEPLSGGSRPLSASFTLG